MGRIITITFNPVIDKSTSIPALIPDKKLRCAPPKFEPGGGGVNVARAIRKLGGEALAIYLAGGYTGVFLNELLKREGVPSRPIEISGHTRENLIVLDASTNQQYRFGMPGPQIAEEEWKAGLQAIEDEEEVSFIVASGSLSSGVPTDIFARIAAIARKKGARLIVDTSGEALKKAAQEGVYLLKPNLAELSSLVGKEEIHAELVDDVARQIIDKGQCEIVITSMGPAGALLVTKEEVLTISPPVVKRQSTVGAGDSMVAGIVWSLSKGWEVKEAVTYGVAAGTAATMNPGTELCHLHDVEKLFRLIHSHQGNA
jgi:6-phosphofructokinase 2